MKLEELKELTEYLQELRKQHKDNKEATKLITDIGGKLIDITN